ELGFGTDPDEEEGEEEDEEEEDSEEIWDRLPRCPLRQTDQEFFSPIFGPD
ncbi:hypothetical protein ADUPG1_014713, partial [Aduncisulcus paluster]